MSDKLIGNENNILFYDDENGKIRVEVLLQNEDIWLNVNAIAVLFGVQRPAIVKHINNIYSDEELEKNNTCSILEHMGNGGKQVYNTKYYNLDMIISIGFRVNSKKAIKFRTWANKILKEYMIKGFALDDNKFINGTKINEKYFEELLERIKLIRTSERVFYQKITDIFAECSIDYNKNSEEAGNFYKSIQNKFHYAITGMTAAEIIYNRADSNKKYMGLKNFKNSPKGKVLKSDIIVAKNYLDERELNELNDLVTIYLDVAENRAKRKIIMKMEDWMKLTCDIFKMNYYDVLEGNGSISHGKAIQKANTEYDKYSIIQDKNYVSDFDELVLETKYIIEKEKDRR